MDARLVPTVFCTVLAGLLTKLTNLAPLGSCSWFPRKKMATIQSDQIGFNYGRIKFNGFWIECPI